MPIALCLSRKHLPAVAIVYSLCNSNNHRRVKTTFNFLQCNIYNHHLASAAGKERFLQFVGQPPVFRRDLGSRSESKACLPQRREYYRRLALLLCDSEEYIRAVMSDIETSNCSLVVYNTTTFLKISRCGTNDNGDVCAGIDDTIYGDVYRSCRRERGCIDHPGIDCSCSSECQTALRQLSDSVGCCIHDDDDPIPSSLWTHCNIQQPEVCADTPNTADIIAKRNVDPCTEECTQRQFLYQFCKHFGERYEELNRECGYENVVYICAYDKGNFCFNFNYLYQFSWTISKECYSDESSVRNGVCSTNCKNLVEELIDKVGCCVSIYNNVFNEDLLSVCGIEAPDACTSFRSTAVPDDYLECAGLTINNSGATLQSGVYTIGVIGLIAIYIL